MSDYLLDKEFLKQVDSYYQREVHAKIVSLDFNENPVTEIQGNITQGTISINGDSSVRRSCNLTLVTSSINVNAIDWALSTKFRVYIGLKNFIDPQKYDDILWFKQGTFIITSFSSQLNQSGYTISIQGKDKMCLLNGDIGGNLFATHDFGKLYTQNNDGTTTIDDIPIYEIIREAIHVYALEPYSNIVINDLDDCAVELLAYRAKGCNLYIVDEIFNTDGVETRTTGMYFDTDMIGKAIKEKGYLDGAKFSIVSNSNIVRNYELIKIVKYGDTAGYRKTDLTYVGDLIEQVGGTITSMLDKIVKMLGEFEYFYDIDGRFIFQRKKIYFNVPWTTLVANGDDSHYATAANTSANVYEFNRGLLVESFQNKPSVNNIKNDFAVWGKMQGVKTEIPIHLRYAIDQKPQIYYSYHKSQEEGRPVIFKTPEYGGNYDWRELLYQMALDNNHYRGKLEDLSKTIKEEGVNAIKADETLADVVEAEELYLSTWNSGYDAYYADMLSFWRDIYNCDQYKKVKNEDGYFSYEKMSEDEERAYFENDYWNPEYVYKQDGELKFIEPQTLPFWIDFIDPTAELGQYAVSVIGRRPKVINDADVKAIFFRETPQVLFINEGQDPGYDEGDLSYTKLNLPASYVNYFSMSSQGKSAKETLDSLVYQHTYHQESISLTAIPVYYLEPNTRILVQDDSSGISGEYLIKTINYSLAHDGMMSITATRAEERIL